MFININGFEVAELENVDYDFNENVTRVETMTRDRRSAGFRKGNKGVSLTLLLAIENERPQINLALANPDNQITIGAEVGGEKLSFIDCIQTQMTGTGSVGNATKTLNIEALDFVDEKGNSRLSDLSLT